MQSGLKYTNKVQTLKDTNPTLKTVDEFKSVGDILQDLSSDFIPSDEEIVDYFKTQRFESITEYRTHRLNQREGDLDKELYDCKKCLNRGFYYVHCDSEGVHFREPYLAQCSCLKIRESLKLSEKSGLGEMKKHRVANFVATDDWQKEVKQLVADYIVNANGEWLLLLGQSGAGKTHLCSAVCNKRLEDGRESIYVLWRDYVARLKESKFDNRRDSENHYFSHVANVEILYIDDLFKGTVTDTDKSYAFELINHRYNKKLTTIVSSELLLLEIADLDQAVAGRMKEMAGKYCFQISKDIKKNYRFKGTK